MWATFNKCVTGSPFVVKSHIQTTKSQNLKQVNTIKNKLCNGIFTAIYLLW